MFQPFGHGVVERGHAARGDRRDGLRQLPRIAGEGLSAGLFHRYVVAEVHHEHFIVRIARLREGRNRSCHTLVHGITWRDSRKSLLALRTRAATLARSALEFRGVRDDQLKNRFSTNAKLTDSAPSNAISGTGLAVSGRAGAGAENRFS